MATRKVPRRVLKRSEPRDASKDYHVTGLEKDYVFSSDEGAVLFGLRHAKTQQRKVTIKSPNGKVICVFDPKALDVATTAPKAVSGPTLQRATNKARVERGEKPFPTGEGSTKTRVKASTKKAASGKRTSSRATTKKK